MLAMMCNEHMVVHDQKTLQWRVHFPLMLHELTKHSRGSASSAHVTRIMIGLLYFEVLLCGVLVRHIMCEIIHYMYNDLSFACKCWRQQRAP